MHVINNAHCDSVSFHIYTSQKWVVNSFSNQKKITITFYSPSPGEGMAEAAATRGPPAVQAALRIWYEEGIIGKFFHGCLHFFFRCFEVILQTCKLTYVFFFFFLLQDFIVVCFLPSFAHYHVLPLCLWRTTWWRVPWHQMIPAWEERWLESLTEKRNR